MNTRILPTALDRTETGELEIQWSDGSQTRLKIAALRSKCPCATCREQRQADTDTSKPPTSLPVLSASEARPVAIDRMQPVGNYAYNIAFSDGHDSGIFTFDFLRSL